MAITIAKTDIKRKCMIATTETSYDSSIDSLIAEMQPAIEYTIADSYLTDTTNTKLQALLKLGILEIVSGEFLQQLARELGNMEQVTVAGITVGQIKEQGPVLIQQGAARLSPYLKVTQSTAQAESSVQSTTKSTEPTFSLDETGSLA